MLRAEQWMRRIDSAMTWLLFLGGLLFLVLGADVMVRGASKLAMSWGISPLVVGLTVVAFGTSAPELAVSVQGAFRGDGSIAMANLVGSNIFNVLGVLGLSALVSPLLVAQQLIKQEVPIMIGASFLLVLMSWNGTVSSVEGGVLVALLIAYLVFQFWQAKLHPSPELEAEYVAELSDIADPSSKWDRHWSLQAGCVVVGLLMLMLGARWLVMAAITVATSMGVSEVIIGLTVVAIGTSLPEIATSVLAAWRGQRDIAVGNAVGSCIFNVLAVGGITAIVAPSGMIVAEALVHFDLLVMLAVMLLCIPMFYTGSQLSRGEGMLFLGVYAAYSLYLLLNAAHHDALRAYSLLMLWVVIPIVVCSVLLIAMNEWRRRRPSVP